MPVSDLIKLTSRVIVFPVRVFTKICIFSLETQRWGRTRYYVIDWLDHVVYWNAIKRAWCIRVS